MQQLEQVLYSLILRNDCVIIPSLGGFVANYVSAKIDVNTGIISPPSKALSFNKNLINNDGLIVNYLAKKENISYEEAQTILTQEIQQIKIDLDKQKRIHFQNIGFLYLNNAGKIAFEQDRFFNLLLSSYGLKNIQFIAEDSVVEEVKVEEKEVAFVPQALEQEIPLTIEPVASEESAKVIEHPVLTEQKQSKHIISKIVRYTAVAALVPLLFYSFWIPLKTDVLKSRMLFIEDFNPFKTSETSLYTLHEEDNIQMEEINPSTKLSDITKTINQSVSTFSFPLDDDLFITVNADVSQADSEVIDHNEQIENNITTNSFPFHAIVGCFKESDNAINLVNELKGKGYQAYEIDVQGGLHRISAGNVNNMTEMNILRQKLTNDGVSSWVLEK